VGPRVFGLSAKEVAGLKLLFVSLLALLVFVYSPARAEDSGPELPGFFDSGFVTNGFFGPSEANQEADRDV